MIFYNLDIQLFIIFLLVLSVAIYITYKTIKKHIKIKSQFNLKTIQKIRSKKIKKNLFIVKKTILLIVLLLVLITILRPKWGLDSEKRIANGIDIVFTLDVSKSMKALDYSEKNKETTRLEAAKEIIRKFVNKRANDRFGLVIFAGEAFTLCPLTIDHNTFLAFLDSVSFEDISNGGTNLKEALKSSLDRFVKKENIEEKRDKTVILITDGEDQDSNYSEIIDIAKEDKINIFTIGLGNKDGSLIPINEDMFGRIQYKKYKGELVKTYLNEEPLIKIAKETNAKYFNPNDSKDLSSIHEEIENMSKSKIETNNQEIMKEQFILFAILAFIFWLIYLFLPDNI